MDLFYREFGQGTHLIILHGLFGTSDNWNTLAKKFGEHFHTVTVDQRNHGQSPHDNAFDYAVMAEDLKVLLDKLDIDKAVLLGHSMGGKTAMQFAVAYPDRVEKLIVSDIAPRYYPVHHDKIIKALYDMDVNQIASRKEAEQKFATLLDDETTRQFLLKSLYWKGEKMAWRFNLDAIAAHIDEVGEAIPEGATYDGPSLFVRGSESNYIKDEDLETIHEHFPAAKLVTIEGSGHWIHAEKPMEFYNAVIKFIMGNS